MHRCIHLGIVFFLCSLAHAGEINFNNSVSYDMPTGSENKWSDSIATINSSSPIASGDWGSSCSLTPDITQAKNTLTFPDDTTIIMNSFEVYPDKTSAYGTLMIKITHYGTGGRDRRHYVLYCGILPRGQSTSNLTVQGVKVDFSFASNDTPIISIPATLVIPKCSSGTAEVVSSAIDIRHKVKGGGNSTNGTYSWSVVPASSNPDSDAELPHLFINSQVISDNTSVDKYRDGVDKGTVSWTCPAKVGSYSWTGTLTFTVE